MMDYFSPEELKNIFENKVRLSLTRGIDGLSAKRFFELHPDYAENISKKIHNGTYKFSPYLEKLILKGKDKKPRVISIPCIRDSIVLNSLLNYIKNSYSVLLPPKMPNSLIFKIKKSLQKLPENQHFFIRLDFKNYYPSINHANLIEKLCFIDDENILNIIRHAISNITVPFDSYFDLRPESNTIGLPQGLPISNILSEIYLLNFDENISSKVKHYCRYVDDILIITDNKEKTLDIVNSNVKTEFLTLNDEKTESNSTEETVNFLGYKINSKCISVKDKNTEIFIKKLQKIFSEYRLNTSRKNIIATDVLIEDLNMRTAGAYSNNKRYGWIIYYSMIDDITKLYEIDSIIKRNLKRYKLLHISPKIKSIVRAYFHIRGKQWASYAHNFDVVTIPEMIKALKIRGLFDENEKAKGTTILLRYQKYVKSQLDSIDKDWGNGYK